MQQGELTPNNLLNTMKTYFRSAEIAHIWAHKSAPSGKSPGAMSFDGDTFYSYSTAIARHIMHNGKAAIVLNRTSFSNTTAKHQGNVRSAIRGLGVPIFHYSTERGSSLDVTGKELFEYAISESSNALKAASKARARKGWHEHEAAVWLESAKAVNAFFGLRRKVDEKTIELLKESSQRAELENEKKRKAEEEERRLEQAEQYEAWKQGTGSSYGFDARLFPVAFRIESREGEGEHSCELVSSLGARVPLDEAKVALRFALSHRQAGWTRNGAMHRVGHYQLDSIGRDGVKAGCHKITWDEIERLTGILS